MKSPKLWGLALSLFGLALANDRPFLVTGSPTPMNGEHPHIRMESEDVYLKVYLGHYDVDARFVFTNDGPAQEVTMGFPEWAHDYERDRRLGTAHPARPPTSGDLCWPLRQRPGQLESQTGKTGRGIGRKAQVW